MRYQESGIRNRIRTESDQNTGIRNQESEIRIEIDEFNKKV